MVVLKTCPIFYANPDVEPDDYCSDSCAWWDSDNECCAILTLAKGFNRAVNEEFGGRSE